MKLEKICATEVRRLAYALAYAFAAAVPHALPADDLTLAAGKSQTISESGTYSYDTITVNGSLTISGSGVNVTAVKVLVAEGAGETGELTVKDGATLTVTGVRDGADYPFTVAHATAATGSANAYGTLNVLNGATVTTHDLLIANMELCHPNHSIAAMNISNATVTVQNYMWTTRGNAYNGYSSTADWYPVTNVLYEGAVLDVKYLIRNASSKTLCSFRGGKLKFLACQSMDGGTLVLSGDGGCPIDVESRQTADGNDLFGLVAGSGGSVGKVRLSGSGGCVIRGSAKLKASSISGTGATHEALTSSYSGPLTLHVPEIAQMAANQLSSTGTSLVLPDDEFTAFDMNGYDAAFATVHEGAGVLRNTVRKSAPVLTVGATGMDGSLKMLTTGSMSVKKLGGGTWTVSGDRLTDIYVYDGTLNIVPSANYIYWKFAPTEVYGPNHVAMQLSGFRLLDADGLPIDLSTRAGTGSDVLSASTQSKLFDDDTSSTVFVQRKDGEQNAHFEAWIQFMRPVAVSGYTWSTAHDYGPDTKWENNSEHPDDLVPPAYDKSYCRDPSAWTLQASNDGVSWIAMDSVSGFKAVNARYTFNTNFSCHGHNTITGMVKIATGATLNVTKPTLLSPVFWQNGGTVNLAPGCRFAIDGAGDSRFFNLPEASSVEKKGTSIVSVQGGTFSNSVHVSDGSLALAGNPGISSKYWRWRVKKLKAWWIDPVKNPNGSVNTPNSFQARGLGLYDKNGNRVNTVSKGTTVVSSSASGMNALIKDDMPTAVCFVAIEHSSWDSQPETVQYPLPDPEDESTWLQLTFKLGDSAPNVYSYAIATAGDHTDRDAVSWDFSISDDGSEWTVIEERDDEEVAIDRVVWTAYNEGFRFPFPVSGDENVLVPGTEVQVDGGAVLAFAGAATVIDKLRIDFAEGAGTLSHFNPAANGELRLENVPAGANLSALALLSVGTAVNAANLSSWAVWVDDSPSPYRLLVSNGSLALLPAGTIMIVR